MQMERDELDVKGLVRLASSASPLQCQEVKQLGRDFCKN